MQNNNIIVTTKGKILREPAVENKYNLNTSQIRKLVVGNRDLIKEPYFWYNKIINAWCVMEEAEKTIWCDETSYWVGIYDEDAPHYAGKFRFTFSTFGGMCGYNFKNFFDEKEIDCEADLIIQEKFLAKINHLLDSGILKFPE